jgi:hypothetical protein
MKTVAFRSGFHSVAQMRMTFSRQMNTTPALYRENMRANEVADEPVTTRAARRTGLGKRVPGAVLRPALTAARQQGQSVNEHSTGGF